RAMGEAAAPLGGLDPDGEELGVEAAGARGVEVEHAAAEITGEVPAFIHEALRGVGVAVDDQRGEVNCCGISYMHWCLVGYREARTTRVAARHVPLVEVSGMNFND